MSELFEHLAGSRHYYDPDLRAVAPGEQILALDARARERVLVAAAERHACALLPGPRSYEDSRFWQSHYAAAGTVAALTKLPFELTRAARRRPKQLLADAAVRKEWLEV